MLNTHTTDFIRKYIEHMTSSKKKNASEVAERGEGGVAGEGRSWGK